MSKPLQWHLRKHFPILGLILVFSTFTNLLMLTSPLFMLQVYDRVLSSRSEPTLIVLFALITLLFAAYGVLDFIRGRLATNIGVTIQKILDPDVFRSVLNGATNTGLNDIRTIKRFFSSPLALAVFDLFWSPLFWVILYLFHPWLGGLALIGGMVLIGIATVNQALGRRSSNAAAMASACSTALAGQFSATRETIAGLGMQASATARWLEKRTQAIEAEYSFSNSSGGFAALTRTLRFYLQSAMLALGAFLVLKGELSAGAMVASSIMLGRMLSPVEQLISGWGQVVGFRQSWRSLNTLLGQQSADASRTPLPRPKACLDVTSVSVARPDVSWVLRQINFSISPGQALGVVGESGAGKSALARVLSGCLTSTHGDVRLGGATLAQFDAQSLSNHIGYLPQNVNLYDGSITENIARLDKAAAPKDIIHAAQTAGAHEMILSLPDGYDTQLSGRDPQLSGGQIQRIGLARAVFGSPVLIILDEPTAHLDAKGGEALNMAIRRLKKGGSAIVVMTHRPAAISECDNVLFLDQGKMRAFGPRDEVLRQITRTPNPSIPPLQAVK